MYMALLETSIVERLRAWLIALGYTEGQIQTDPQYQIRASIRGKKRVYPVDVAVFRGTARCDEDLLLIAECRRSGEAAGVSKGMDRLRKCLRWSGCPVGVWFNGADVAVVTYARNAISLTAIPSSGEVSFGEMIRRQREFRDECAKRVTSDLRPERVGERFSVRAVAKRAGIQATYLSKIERNEVNPPSDKVIYSLASVLGMDVNALLIAAGRTPADLQKILLMRPDILSDLVRSVKADPRSAVSNLVLRRSVRDGKW